ncbi:hypothetical protein P7K49_028650, partial [Saguinus oedipus]
CWRVRNRPRAQVPATDAPRPRPRHPCGLSPAPDLHPQRPSCLPTPVLPGLAGG